MEWKETEQFDASNEMLSSFFFEDEKILRADASYDSQKDAKTKPLVLADASFYIRSIEDDSLLYSIEASHSYVFKKLIVFQ